MRKGFLIYEEMRKYLVIYEEAVSHIYMTLQPLPSVFPPWMKEVKGIRHGGGGPTYAARSLPQYNSAFATRVLLSTYVCGEL